MILAGLIFLSMLADERSDKLRELLWFPFHKFDFFFYFDGEPESPPADLRSLNSRIIRDPNDIRARVELARSYQSMPDFESSQTILREALRQIDTHSSDDCSLVRAEVLANLNIPDEALAIIDAREDCSPEESTRVATVYYTLALHLLLDTRGFPAYLDLGFLMHKIMSHDSGTSREVLGYLDLMAKHSSALSERNTTDELARGWVQLIRSGVQHRSTLEDKATMDSLKLAIAEGPALECFAKAAALDPNDYRSRMLQLTLCLMSTSKSPDSESKKLVDLMDDRRASLYSQAVNELEALALGDTPIALRAARFMGLFNSTQAKELDRGILMMERVVGLSSDEEKSKALLGLYVLLMLNKQYDKALEIALQLIRLEESEENYLHAARCFFLKSNFADAKEHIEHALLLRPDSFEGLTARGVICLKTKENPEDWQPAWEDIKAAILAYDAHENRDLDEWASMSATYGIALAMIGEDERALEILSQLPKECGHQEEIQKAIKIISDS